MEAKSKNFQIKCVKSVLNWKRNASLFTSGTISDQILGDVIREDLYPVVERQWCSVLAWLSLEVLMSSKEKELVIPWDQEAVSQQDSRTCLCYPKLKL